MRHAAVRQVLLGGVLGLVLALPAAAQYTEVEDNGSKTAANIINLGTATSATVSGTSANSSDSDYFRINTSYQTKGIYVNQFQLNNTSSFIGSIRGLTQTTGTVNAGTDVVFQSSQTSGTAQPYGFNQYYSFGGASKTQSVYYKVVGAGSATGGSYTATFSSSLVTPTNIGSVGQGDITFNALANIGSSGTATNTSIVVFDSNFNLYYDNVNGSPTNGYASKNDNASAGFSLKRRFDPGTYFFAVGISNLATNDAAAPDDATASRSNSVLDFDNVIATGNTFYNGNNGNTRPADFSITNSSGNVVYTSSSQVIPSLYAVNFYQITVTQTPEPSSWLLAVVGVSGYGAWFLCRKRAARTRRPCRF